MKKILFLLLLLFTIASYGQAVFDEGIQITGNANSATATKVNVQEANGKVNTQTINTGFNKNIGLGGSDVVGANTLLNQYSTTPVDWTATAFNSGQVVFYGGKQWIAKIATVAGDVPAVSLKWEEITFEALANKTVTVDQTIIDGSTNAVSGNAVFDVLEGKAPIVHNHTVSQITDFPTFKTIEGQSVIGAGNIDLDKNSVGLGNVDNTSDLNKIISTATQTALNAKANISGQVFTGAVSATNLSGTNTGDNAPNSLYSGLVTNATHTGEVTGSTALTITNGAVTNAKLANVATSTLKGRVTATTGVVEDLTASQVRTLLNVANGANNYVHPANHLASIITQDASNRFVTDTEKSAWNAKESAIASGTISQYWRGDKTWQPFPAQATVDQTIIDGSTNAVSGNAVFDGLATKQPAITGLTTNYLSKWNGSSFGNSQVFDDGGNVGIGTNAPASKLEVAGSIRSVMVDAYPTIGATNYGSVGFPLLQLRNVINSVDKAWNIENGRIVNGDLGFYNEGGQRITFKNNGRVLINKTDDDLTNQLQVAGTISASPATTANQVPTWGQVQAVASGSGIWTPATNGVLSYTKSYWIKSGNVVSFTVNGNVNSSIGSSTTIALPNGFNISSPITLRTIGVSKLLSNQDVDSGVVRILEISSTNTVSINTSATVLGTYSFSVNFTVQVQ